jgi:hypothetical protein
MIKRYRERNLIMMDKDQIEEKQEEETEEKATTNTTF